MKTGELIEIPLSKIKLTLMLTGSIIFVAIGFWFVIKKPVTSLPVLGNSTIMFIVGIISILFFGICAIFVSQKITENTPGLIINDEGITDNSSGVSAGLVLWRDISEIRKTNVFNQAFIIVIVKNPEEYIARQTNFLKKRLMTMNYKSYGSPVNISPNSLKCNFNELYLMIVKEFQSAKN